MRTALFIGRFQPFHLAHLEDVKLELDEGNKVIIAIGSSQESHTKENPFTFEERKEMIQDVLKDHKINAEIMAVPDINENEKWVDHVKTIIPDFNIVYTGNDLTEQLFKEKDTAVRKITLIPGISATEIRKRIINNENWQELVPKEIISYIRKINGIERIKSNSS